MKIKKIILFLLLLSVIFGICSCSNFVEYEYNGVIYETMRPISESSSYNVSDLSDEGKEMEIIYIYDEIDGNPVTRIGNNSPMVGANSARFYGKNMVKIYFPWSIASSCGENDASSILFCFDKLKYIFSTNVNEIVCRAYYCNTVVPLITYEEDVSKKFLSPANIAYFFNYEGNPNEGYFFIDLLEESGTLTKPRYDPKREGYTFEGWYKEAECINAWNFDTDTVIINYDEEGNRIYEEFCLYAKWAE